MELQNALQQDPYTRSIMADLSKDSTSHPNFHVADKKLYYKSRLVIPNLPALKEKLLAESHDTLTAGHGGYLKTLKRLTATFFWPKMKQEVKNWVQNCLICQQSKYQALAPAGLLQPLPIPNQIWEDISIDFIIGLPKSGGYDTILVVVDRLSKYSHFIPLSHPYTAKSVASIFCREIVRLHGIPKSIVSDRDAIFLSTFWQELFKLSQTRLAMSTAYHPQSDGQTEVVNRCLETYLRCFVHEQPHSWHKFLHWAEYSFNTGFHTSTGTSPFKSVYGREPPTIQPYVQGETQIAELEEQLIKRDDMLKILKDNLLRAQSRMKAQADSKRRELQFNVGDLVFLRIQPYRQRSLAKRRYEKLSPRFFGPYKIIRRVGSVAYELELPTSAKIHPIFHVSLLRPAYGQQTPFTPPPLPINSDGELTLSPSKILGHRWIKEGGVPTLELLVQWDECPLEEASWENYDLLAGQFPGFHLGDKVSFQRGSNDTVPPLRTYSRRQKCARQTENLDQVKTKEPTVAIQAEKEEIKQVQP